MYVSSYKPLPLFLNKKNVIKGITINKGKIAVIDISGTVGLGFEVGSAEAEIDTEPSTKLSVYVLLQLLRSPVKTS